MLLSAVLILATVDPWSMSGEAETLKHAANSHRLDIGTAVDPAFLAEGQYASILSSEFSVIEPENAMKFGPIHPRPGSEPSSFDFSNADKLVDFAKSHGLKVRGHTLVWHNQNASWVASGKPTSADLLATLDGHIGGVVGHFSRQVFAWDVVNEAFNDDGTLRHTIWYDKPGIGYAGQGWSYIEHALRVAHKADPRAKLFYNDYGAETLGAKADGIYAMAKDFKARKVPLDGIGFQCHFIMQMNNPGALGSIETNFKRFAALGLDIHITELDIRIPDATEASLTGQADFYRKFVEICRRLTNCKLIQTWGFTDKHSWIPGVFRGMGWALLWDANYQPKPSYRSVLQALEGRN